MTLRPFFPLRSLAPLLTTLVLAAACGGSDDAVPPAGTTIGAAGGTVSGAAGAQVVVPPGALAASTTIAIEQSSAGAPALPGGFTAAGAVFAITPHGTSFAVPVTVSLPIDAAGVPAGQTGSLYKTDSAGVWQRVAGATVSGNVVTAQVTAFSFFGFGSAPPVIPASQQPQSTSVMVGATATFAVNALGAPPFTYLWQRSTDGGASWVDTGVTTQTYTTAATTLADSGLRVRVIVSNPDGPTTSQAAILTVTATPPPPPPPPPPPATGAVRIAAGNSFSLAVNAAAVPYSWGTDGTGQLGNGAATGDRSTAATLGTITGVRSVSAGAGSQGVAVMSDGSVRAWGYRGSIDCVFGATAPAPIVIAGASGITAASTGGDHTLLLRNDGVVLSFGCNDSGQLGRAGSSPSTSATVVPGLPTIVAVAAGRGFSLALDGSGNVWSWGRGALGDGSAAAAMRPAPAQIAGLSAVTAIAAGTDHALALKADGSVLAWGSNLNGKLGDGGEANQTRPVATLLTQRITAIAAGEDNSLALRDDGVVLSWGINETGQLGSGLSTPGFRPQPAPVVGLASVVAIAFGKGLGHGLALRSDGSVWAWGRNDAGQIGDGSTTTRLAPVAVAGLNLN